ncbi:MAG TPA: transglycosylase SLT domain-containing protein [Burkholderiaceae bacterium]|nr:transglycosylase SLT domain-containing protein [Burkholderiaceae bacterium]
MQFRTILTLIALTLSFTAQAQPKGDDLILEMNQAFKRGDKRKLAQLLPQARGHVLEPWAAYWELRGRLDEATPQELQDFFARYTGSYQEDRLRNDWLLLLGQRRDWTAFAEEYPRYRMADDKELRCYAVLVEHTRAANPTTAMAAQWAQDVRRNWFALREADDGCTIAADRLLAAKLLTPHDAWRKARLAIEANRPRAARNAVALVAPEVLNQVNELNDSPAKYLTSRVTVASTTRKELVVLALLKMASNDADTAATLLENKWGVQLSPEERNWTWGAIGRQAAMRLSAGAPDHFAKVSKDSDLSDDMLAWKVRAALRQGKWRQVIAATGAMSEESRQDPAWVYWKARARLALARSDVDRVEPTQMLEGIASVRGFYEQLAMEELGRQISVPPKPEAPTPEEKEAARLNAGLNRGLYAIALGLRSEGVREWNYTTNLHTRGGMSDRELLAAADFACQREVWDRCINTSDRTRAFIDFDQRFPMPFREAVVKRTRDINLDPAYVYGLIRQESRFIMDARSHVGASGLMQVMPATARWTAKKIGLTDFTPNQISDRDTNIAIGTGYLKLVLDDFAGSMPLAAAAYNAGPGRPRNWRNGPLMEAAIWAENVPFNETRDYVKKVLSNTTNYAAILSGQPQSLKARLGTVGPRDNLAPEVNKDLP